MRAPLVRQGIEPWIRESSITGLVLLEETDSTNAEVQRRGVSGTAVIADFQHGGRGRIGRQWQEVPYAGLAISVLLPAPAEHAEWVPLATGLALRAAIAGATGFTADLKWPNDLLDPAGAGKLAGILCELTPAGVVIGTGLNVDHDAAELPVPTATSLALVLGSGAGHGRLPREELAGRFLAELSRRHTDIREGGPALARVREDYRAACATIGSEVTVAVGTSQVRGRVDAVDDEGRILVTGEEGRATVAAGDVTHVRPAR